MRERWLRRRDGGEEDWRARRGQFAGLDADTPGRPQVKPVPRPADRQDETHNIGPDGIRAAEGDEAGPWGGDDGD
jgi:hypothetical protein